ncbi:hypothetical protein BV25DRAFT_519666 [Artomyces pyxidatus]|uniref:Uncharacterized protein n=1 Tax=Artomyces pyxidatus TaxID=48021 RepID=A0ACB8TI14_9AGAM|nr:hypothetical protein BV25DRAFT_519666 [Artomyces pyxidatus]
MSINGMQLKYLKYACRSRLPDWDGQREHDERPSTTAATSLRPHSARRPAATQIICPPVGALSRGPQGLCDKSCQCTGHARIHPSPGSYDGPSQVSIMPCAIMTPSRLSGRRVELPGAAVALPYGCLILGEFKRGSPSSTDRTSCLQDPISSYMPLQLAFAIPSSALYFWPSDGPRRPLSSGSLAPEPSHTLHVRPQLAPVPRSFR